MADWRVVPFGVGAAAEQLKLTEGLWQEVASGAAPATLRWYSYDAPALVLGIGQGERDVDVEAAERDGLAVVKRASGGAVVFAGPQLVALDVAVPSDSRFALTDVVESYRWLGEVFVRALRRASPKVSARVTLISPGVAREDQRAQRRAGAESPEHGRARACFGVLSPYEIGVATDMAPIRKLVGLSQIRKRGVTLYQTGVHTRFVGAELARYLPSLPGLAQELDRRVADLEDVGMSGAEALMGMVTEAIVGEAPESVG